MRWRQLSVSLCLGLALAGVLGADVAAQAGGGNENVGTRLEGVRDALRRGRDDARAAAAERARLEEELGAIRSEMRAAAQASHSYEAAITRLEIELESLAAERTRKRAALDARRDELTLLLAALERMALRPPAALMAAPGDANDAVRTAVVLGAIAPRIDGRAKALRQELDALAAIRAEMMANREALASAENTLARVQARLRDASRRKQRLFNAARDDESVAAKRIEALVKEARTLSELLSKLEEERARNAEARGARGSGARGPGARGVEVGLPPPGGTPIAEARGRLTPPVQGLIVRKYGETTAVGTTSRGLTFAARPGAMVVAPWDGRVAYAGPFKEFGQILIIEHGDGYHSLLAGLADIDATVGQWVLAGEPVGATGDGEDGAGTAAGGSGLYVELRRHGQPINPLPWLAITEGTKG